jgi:hypothetical protein
MKSSYMKEILDPWFTYNESRIHKKFSIPGNTATQTWLRQG